MKQIYTATQLTYSYSGWHTNFLLHYILFFIDGFWNIKQYYDSNMICLVFQLKISVNICYNGINIWPVVKKQKIAGFFSLTAFCPLLNFLLEKKAVYINTFHSI